MLKGKEFYIVEEGLYKKGWYSSYKVIPVENNFHWVTMDWNNDNDIYAENVILVEMEDGYKNYINIDDWNYAVQFEEVSNGNLYMLKGETYRLIGKNTNLYLLNNICTSKAQIIDKALIKEFVKMDKCKL